MSNPDGVLEAIDACLNDSLSPDAMRWAPDEPDLTPESDSLTGQLARFLEERLDLPVYGPGAVAWSGGGWPIIRDDEISGTLEWDAVISPAHGAIVTAADLGPELTPAPGELLRIAMPDASQSTHRVVSVTPGETPGEFVLTLEPAPEGDAR